jgi:hypothetical protein
MGVRPQRECECAGKSEICDFDYIVLRHTEIVWLEIAVKDALRMQKGDPTEHLPGHWTGARAECVSDDQGTTPCPRKRASLDEITEQWSSWL